FLVFFFFFFQAEDGIRDFHVTGVQTCALPISKSEPNAASGTPRSTLHGILQLSYRATRRRNTSTRASTNARTCAPLASFSWSASPVHSYPYPAGSAVLATASMAVMA